MYVCARFDGVMQVISLDRKEEVRWHAIKQKDMFNGLLTVYAHRMGKDVNTLRCVFEGCCICEMQY